MADNIENFNSKLDKILKPLETVEEIQSYPKIANRILEQVIAVLDSMAKVFCEEKKISVPEKLSTELEDQMTSYFNVPEIPKILNKMSSVRERMTRILTLQEMSEEVHDLANQDTEYGESVMNGITVHKLPTIVPTDSLPVPTTEQSGKGWQKKENIERLQALLYLFSQKLPNQDSIEKLYIEKTSPDMVRQTSYIALSLPSLQRIIYLCNEYGNVTFVFDSKKVNPDDLTLMTKSEKKEFIQNNPGSGIWFIYHDKDWLKTLEQYLFGQIPKMKNKESLKKFLQQIFIDEGVVKIEKNNEGQTVLTWINTITANEKPKGCSSYLNTLVGQWLGIDGQKKYKNFKSIIPVIRELFAGQYDIEAYDNKDIQYLVASKEQKKKMLCNILLDKKVVKLEENEKKKRVLTWIRPINPQKKPTGFSFPFYTLLGQFKGVKGSVEYTNFVSIIPVIRELFADQYDIESYAKNMQFLFASKEEKQKMLWDILLDEKVVKLEKNKDEKTVFTWMNRINPQKKPSGFNSTLSTLLRQWKGVNGQKEYKNFKNIIPVIRELFADQYDIEAYANKNMQFLFASKEQKQKMLCDILLDEKVVEIEKNEDEKVILKIKRISPLEKPTGFNSPLNILIGQWKGISAQKKYRSFESIIPFIEELFEGQYDNCVILKK